MGLKEKGSTHEYLEKVIQMEPSLAVPQDFWEHFEKEFPREFTFPERLEVTESETAASQEAWLQHLEALRGILLKAIVRQKRNGSQVELDSLREEFFFWESKAQLEGLQILQALRNLVCLFLDLDPPEFSPCLEDNGTSFLETKGIWTWGRIPHQRFQGELSALFGILYLKTGREEFKEACTKGAEWQLSILGDDFLPFPSLFCREEDFYPAELISQSYLLFHTAACLSQEGHWEHAAQMQWRHLSRLLENSGARLPVFSTIMATWVEEQVPPPRVEIGTRENSFSSSEMALGLIRNNGEACVLSMSGEGTGFGSWQKGEIEVCNFGPQMWPLGDGSAFGFLSSAPEDLKLDVQREKMIIEGLPQVAGRTGEKQGVGFCRLHQTPGIYLDSKLSYSPDGLDVSISPFGWGDPSQVAMTFYIKADCCRLGRGVEVWPRSLDHFRGPSGKLEFLTGKECLILDPGSNCESMELIPLAGGQVFWGAHFLVAFDLKTGDQPFTWNLRIKKQEA